MKSLFVCRASAGTGKTFNLAAYYIALLLSGDSYRSILAVTFTNKATMEMQERILLHLHLLRRGDKQEDGFIKLIRAYLNRLGRKPITDEQIRERAEGCFKAILSDFDGMRVTTIDAFLQLLLQGMSHSLGQTMGAEVNLDTKQAISDAVDAMMTTDIDLQEGLRKAIISEVNQQMNAEKGWDIRTKLQKLANEIFTEAVQTKNIDWRIDTIRQLRQACDVNQIPLLKQVKELAAQLPELTKDDVPYSNDYNKIKQNLLSDFNEHTFVLSDRARKNMSAFKRPQPLWLQVLEMLDECDRLYLNAKLTEEHLSAMALVGFIRHEINMQLVANNQVLLADTAKTLAEALKPQDADFILEKAGLRYKHILLDEFQDTSTLQWANFLPLVEEILSNGGTAFVVGDTKQGIYRFRNGDWTIMEQLGSDEDKLKPYFQRLDLKRNFRSEKEVIAHNLHIFQGLEVFNEGYTGTNLDEYHRPDCKGGYVSLRRLDDEQSILLDMFDTIERLLSEGARAKDILILVRFRDEAQLVAKQLNELAMNPEQYPNLAKVELTSADSFVMMGSQSVRRVIAALRYDKTLDRTLPLYELTEQVIRRELTDNGEFTGTDLAYLNAFRDKQRDYIVRHGSNLDEFLLYWDERMSQETILAPEGNAIRVMTVHASKGLEGKILMIPFLDWKMEKSGDLLWCKSLIQPIEGQTLIVPITNKASAGRSGYADVVEYERMQQMRDNQNLVYVALTRARDALFMWYRDQKSKTVADIVTAVGGEEYEAGEWPVFTADKDTKDVDHVLTATYHSENQDICFRQSQESQQYYAGGEVGRKDVDSATFGTICHDILSQMTVMEDADRVIGRFRRRGVIDSDEMQTQISDLITRAWNLEQMRDWFSGRYELMCEDTIMTGYHGQVQIYRPDRVMIIDNKAVVLDYKFGAYHDDYAQQVQTYIRLMTDLGYQTEGYLWMAKSNKLIKVEI